MTSDVALEGQAHVISRAKEIFELALLSDAADRERFVRSEAGGDKELAALVLKLLEQHVLMTHSISQGNTVNDHDHERIGPYKIISTIGEGAFGTVYLAEQREPVRRRVALKLIKLGMDSKEVIARFEAERQALAMMDHPNVAKVYDAGTTARGQPYFSMEHVPGVSITQFADDQKLTVKERVELFIQVCQAVQHAHQKGIIHRDLKPSNILVTLIDTKPVAKVIDFGVAKATGQQLTARTLYTETGRLMGTPEYMSPEQAGTSGLDVDTRSDIYSLGVILYQLLGGTLPFESETLRKAGFEGTIRLIKEVDPPRLTTRLSRASNSGESIEDARDDALPPAPDASAPKARAKNTPQEVAAKRRTDLSGLIRLLRGDLDWIVARAMEKERARRYETANALAMDLQRHLNNEPVVAGPPSRMYRLSRAVKRNRAWIAAAAVAAILLVAGTIGTSWGLVVARQKRAEAITALAQAKARADELEQVAKFQENQLSQVDPTLMGLRIRDDLIEDIAKGMEQDKASPEAIAKTREDLLNALSSADLTGVAVNALDRNVFAPTLKAIDEQFKSQPLIQARLLHALAATKFRIGLSEEAVELERQALAIRTKEQGPDHSDTLRTMGDLVDPLHDVDPKEAVVVARAMLARSLEALGREHVVTAFAMSQLGYALLGADQSVEAEPILREALDRNRLLLGPDHPQTLCDLQNFAHAIANQGHYNEALLLFEEALRGRRARFGDDNVDTISASMSIVTTLRDLGRIDDALTRSDQVFETSLRMLGEEHPDLLTQASVRMSLLNLLNRHSESLRVAQRFEPLARRVWIRNPFFLGVLLTRVGIALCGVGDFAKAESTLLESHALLIRSGQKPGSRWLKECTEALVALYKAWDKAEPGQGYDAKATQWQAELEAGPEPHAASG